MTQSIETKFSIASISSIISALLSFKFGAILGMLFAIIAILTGIVGMAMALSPRVRGGLLSTISLLMGLIGVVAAIVKVFV